jgi:ubiquinone/menaquinone biosynthesis C-methylase UbiE
MILTDPSSEMIKAAKRNLKRYRTRTRFEVASAHEFLRPRSEWRYHAIFSSFVVHNFKRRDRFAVFEDCYRALRHGGMLILDESVRVGDKKLDRAILRNQIRRYRYLPKEVADAVVDHIKQDFSAQYRIDEEDLVNELRAIGFRSVKVIDRVEHEALVIARK